MTNKEIFKYTIILTIISGIYTSRDFILSDLKYIIAFVISLIIAIAFSYFLLKFISKGEGDET